MPRKVRTALIIAAAATVVFLGLWILLPPMVQGMRAGSEDEIRTFDPFDPLPTYNSRFDTDAEGLTSESDDEIDEVEENRIEIEGVDPTPSSTPEYEVPSPVARPSTILICHTGPRTCDPPLAILTPDHLFPVDWQAYEGLWLRLILIPTDLTCWVSADDLDVSGDVDQLPELDPTPWPCPTVTPTDTPPGCWVVDAQHPNGYCRPGACTPNDFPGTTCTPP